LSWIDVLILSFIEGATEFLPVSSTGHLIVTSAFLKIQEDGFVKSFNIIIQFGAILSVVFVYWRKFLPNVPFYKKLLIAFLPAAVLGLLLKNKIDAVLGSLLVVGLTTFLGGFVLVWSDHYFKAEGNGLKDIQDLTWQDSLKLGLIQCLAFLPGVSRSGATIIGGLSLGLSRKAAAEFSFFLAVPTLTGAAFIKTWQAAQNIEFNQITYLLAGVLLSFLFALLAIKAMVSVVSHHGFRYFGYYRILLGIVILVFYFRGST
jgi:undecaprenyl-diphosphatase